MTINERLVQPRFASVLPEREPDEIDERDNPVSWREWAASAISWRVCCA